jgi:hypothetical protein
MSDKAEIHFKNDEAHFRCCESGTGEVYSFLLQSKSWIQLPNRLARLMGRRHSGGGGGGRGRGRGRGRDEEEDLPLHKAARSGDAAAVESVCESNPLAVNSRDRLSRTPYEPPPSLQVLPFPPSFPLYLITSREAPSSRALRYGSLSSY